MQKKFDGVYVSGMLICPRDQGEITIKHPTSDGLAGGRLVRKRQPAIYICENGHALLPDEYPIDSTTGKAIR